MLRRATLLVSLAALAGCSNAAGPAPRDSGGGSVVISLGDAGPTCLGSGGVVSAVADGGAPDPMCTTSQPTVSYAQTVGPVLAGCSGGEVCHAPWTYDTVVWQRSGACCDRRWLVEPGYPSHSLLVQALTGVGSCVPRMPLVGQLDDASVSAIVAWVCQGARNN